MYGNSLIYIAMYDSTGSLLFSIPVFTLTQRTLLLLNLNHWRRKECWCAFTGVPVKKVKYVFLIFYWTLISSNGSVMIHKHIHSIEGKHRNRCWTQIHLPSHWINSTEIRCCATALTLVQATVSPAFPASLASPASTSSWTNTTIGYSPLVNKKLNLANHSRYFNHLPLQRPWNLKLS